MSSFKGNKDIELQPNDTNVSFGFTFTVASSTTANDGYLPYGTTVSGVTAVAYKTADENGRALGSGETVVEDLIGAPTVESNVVTIRMNYPSTSGAGYYKVTTVVSVSDGSTLEADFNRIQAINR